MCVFNNLNINGFYMDKDECFVFNVVYDNGEVRRVNLLILLFLIYESSMVPGY